MYNKLILWLIRRKFKLGLYDAFRFENQKSDAFYWFNETGIFKNENLDVSRSNVSLNWLLDPECKIIKL